MRSKVIQLRLLPLLQVGVAAGLASLPQLSGGVPKGYLRVLVFDKDSALVSQQTQQLSQAAKGGYEPLRLQVRLPQDGYVSAYVGNESDVDVLFDDVTVEHRPGLQGQETQYDPAGLELAGLAPPSPGIRGLNNYRFNGKEFQADLGLNWNHQDWRFLDLTDLHWNGIDPEIENGQESWSPYSFGFDNAVRYADANGRAPDGPGDPPSGTVLPAPGVLQQMWRDVTNPSDFKHFLNDLADFPPLAAESGVMNVLRTLSGAANIADYLPTPTSQAAQPPAATLASDKTFTPPATQVSNTHAKTTVIPAGVVYERTNPKTGGKYVGQAKSDERFEKRQKEHDKAKGVAHDYDVLERAAPGKDLDVAEEKHIRAGGGPNTKANPDGKLENKRSQMSDKRYKEATTGN